MPGEADADVPDTRDDTRNRLLLKRVKTEPCDVTLSEDHGQQLTDLHVAEDDNARQQKRRVKVEKRQRIMRQSMNELEDAAGGKGRKVQDKQMIEAREKLVQDPEPQRKPPTRHKVLWFKDGNVRVRSSGNKEFRLHEGILSYHSHILKGLIEEARRNKYNRSGSEDCSDPIELHLPESSRALSSFFGVIYDGVSSVYNDRDRDLYFWYLRVVLCLGIKYEVKPIVDAGLWRLRALFPTQLNKWNTRPINQVDSLERDDFRAEDAIFVVHLARKVGALDMLPTAYYTCCTLPPATMVKGVKYGCWDGDQYSLSDDELRMCHVAQAELQKMRSRILRIFMEGPTGTYDNVCTNTGAVGACRSKMQQMALQAVDAELNSVGKCFSFLGRWISKADRTGPDRMCATCQKAVKNDIATRMEEEWGKLGQLFKIEDWPIKKT